MEILLSIEKHQEKDENIGFRPTACYRLLRERLGVNISKTMYQDVLMNYEKKITISN